MHATHPTRGGALAAAFVLVLAAAAIPVASAATADEAAARQQQHMQMFQAHMKARLDRMAGRLEIKASQQAAWGEFVKASEAMIGPHPARPAQDADAASMVRQRAEMAAGMAQKLAALADATSKLQAVLDPDQQKTLNQIVRSVGRHGHHGEMQHRSWGHGEKEERGPR